MTALRLVLWAEPDPTTWGSSCLKTGPALDQDVLCESRQLTLAQAPSSRAPLPEAGEGCLNIHECPRQGGVVYEPPCRREGDRHQLEEFVSVEARGGSDSRTPLPGTIVATAVTVNAVSIPNPDPLFVSLPTLTSDVLTHVRSRVRRDTRACWCEEGGGRGEGLALTIKAAPTIQGGILTWECNQGQAIP